MVETQETTQTQRSKEELLDIRRDFNKLAIVISKAKTENKDIPDEASVLVHKLVELRQLNPQELTTIIFDNPHTVYINGKETNDPPIKIKRPKIFMIPPKKDELDVSKAEINLKHIDDENIRYVFSSATNSLKTYLKGNYIKDNFENIDDRKAWENQTLEVLKVLDEKYLKETANRETGFRETFKRSWDNNKYSKNFRTKVNLAINLMVSQLETPDGEPISAISSEGHKKLKALANQSTQLVDTPKLERREAYDITKLSNELAIGTLRALSSESTWNS